MNKIMLLDVFEISYEGFPLSQLEGELFATFTMEIPTLKEFGFLYSQILTELNSVEKLMLYGELLYLGLLEFPISDTTMIGEVEYLWKI